MENEEVKRVVGTWLLEYYSYLIWKQFEKDGHIRSCWLRDCINDCDITQEGSTPICADGSEHIGRLLIEFMYKLSFGEQLLNDDHNSRQTALEDAIDIFQQLLKVDNIRQNLDWKIIKRVRLLLKQQSILVCWRNNDFQLSKIVFVRQWKECRNTEELKVKNEISEILSQSQKSQVYCELMPYSSLIACSQLFLKKIIGSRNKPFLYRAGESVYEHFRQLESENLSKPKHVFGKTSMCNDLDADIISSSQSHGKDAEQSHRSPNSNTDKFEATSEVEVFNKTVISQCDLTVIQASKMLPVSVKEETKLDRHLTVNCNNESEIHSTGLDRCTSSLHIPEELPDSKRKCREKKLEFSTADWEEELDKEVFKQTNEPKKRKAWSLKEEETLYEAVQKFGLGQWRQVADFLHSGRSNVDVKDKWRSMTKLGKIKTFQDMYGPVIK